MYPVFQSDRVSSKFDCGVLGHISQPTVCNLFADLLRKCDGRVLVFTDNPAAEQIYLQYVSFLYVQRLAKAECRPETDENHEQQTHLTESDVGTVLERLLERQRLVLRLVGRQKSVFKTLEPFLVVFDGDFHTSLFREQHVRELFVHGRFYKLSTLIITRNWLTITPFVLFLLDVVLVCVEPDDKAKTRNECLQSLWKRTFHDFATCTDFERELGDRLRENGGLGTYRYGSPSLRLEERLFVPDRRLPRSSDKSTVHCCNKARTCLHAQCYDPFSRWIARRSLLPDIFCNAHVAKQTYKHSLYEWSMRRQLRKVLNCDVTGIVLRFTGRCAAP